MSKLAPIINGFDALAQAKPDSDGVHFAPLFDKGDMGFAIESIPPGKQVKRHYHKARLTARLQVMLQPINTG